MTKHTNKIGHLMSKALARQNRERDALQMMITAADQFSETMIPETTLPETEDGNPIPAGKVKRKAIGDGKWEGGFKLIEGSYNIRRQRHGVRKCINLHTNSITTARERREDLKRLLVDQKYFGVNPNITVSQLWEKYSQLVLTRISPRTFETYRNCWEKHILPLIGDMLAHSVDNNVVEQVLAEYLGLFSQSDKNAGDNELEDEGIRPERGNRILAALKVVFYWGVMGKLLVTIPFTNQKVPTQQVRRPYVSFREIHPFLETIRNHSDDPDERDLQISMAIYLGTRSNEIRIAKGSWFNLEMGTFTPMLTKTKSTRTIPIPKSLLIKVKVFFQDRNIGPNTYLFPKANGKGAVGRGFLRHAVQKAGQAIGKPALTPHRLRSSFATLHAIAGTPIRVIQYMLGHKCISTTLLYIEEVPELNLIAQHRLDTLIGFGDLGAPGTAPLRPWHEEIGHLMGNLTQVPDMEPAMAASSLLEISSVLKTIEVALQKLVGTAQG